MTKRNDIFLLFGILSIILLIAFIPKEIYEQTRYFENDDKIKHFFAFFVLSFLYFKKSFTLNIRFKVIILISLAFFIEVFQSFLNREFSIFDFFASIIGVFSFLVLKYVIKK